MTTNFVQARLFKLAIVSVLLVGSFSLQVARTAAQIPDANVIERVVERGPHHKEIETTRTILDQSGQPVTKTGRYILLQNGLHYRNEAGDWVESQELIEPHPDGATATHGPHKVIFSNNLNQEGPDVLMPDGGRMLLNALGLVWRDTATGQTRWIATVKDCQGVILPPNQVIYESAFDDIEADIRYTYTTGALESDVILHEAPKLPTGFNPKSSRLEVVTMFRTSMAPEVVWHSSSSHTGRTRPEKNQESRSKDCMIDFGTMQLTRGKAFASRGADAATAPTSLDVPVVKHWQPQNGGGTLVESVEYLAVRDLLAQLPTQQAKREDSQPKSPAAATAAWPGAGMRVASNKTLASGLVIDFILVYSTSYWTFATDQTYKINSAVIINHQATFQSVATVKFTTQGSLQVERHLIGPGTLTPRAVLTHIDDNSVGEPLGSGTVQDRYPFALLLDTLATREVIQRLEIRHAQKGMDFYYCDEPTVQNCLWRSCDIGIRGYWTDIFLNSLFMCSVTTLTQDAGEASFYGQETIVTDCTSALHAPQIITQPANQTVSVGGGATFSVVASGYGLTYQWYFNGTSISGATSSSYTRSNAQHTQAGFYHVVVANDIGEVKSAKATLTVNGPPLITLHPSSQTVAVGGSVTFSVAAIGGPPCNANQPFCYNWKKNGLVMGRFERELTIDNVQSSDAAQYSAVVYNSSGQTESQSALLTVTATCQDKDYTSNADFDNGVLINLNHDTPGELRLNTVPRPLPYVNMACSYRGTIVRLDANSGAVLGEYRTAVELVPENPWYEPSGDNGPSPSRTTVDRFGNVWVGNRQDDQNFGGVWKGSVARIGVLIGGIRGDRAGVFPNYTFTPNPQGEYLSPPFVYSTCLDRDGDGFFRTSRGLGHVLRWENANGSDTDGGVESAEDEAILNYVRVVGTSPRLVAADANNNVWTGGWFNRKFERLDGVTGEPVPGTQFDMPEAGGYGGLVDGLGFLWSSTGGGFSPLLKYDPLSSPPCCVINTSYGDYGLAIDPSPQSPPTVQHVWHSKVIDGLVCKLNTSGLFLALIYHGAQDAQGVTVDCNQNVWVAHSHVGDSAGSQTTVGHIRTDQSMWIGNVHLSISPNIKPGPTGVAVDTNGKVWVSNKNANNAMRINPNAGPYSSGGVRIGAVDLTVDLGDGTGHQPPHDVPAGPYNYSDMTGYQFLGATSQSGCWVFVHDGHGPDKNWNMISWTESKPLGTQIRVEVRAANKTAWLAGTGTAPRPFLTVGNGLTFGGIVGRHLEVRVTLLRSIDVTSTPVLYSLKVHCPSN